MKFKLQSIGGSVDRIILYICIGLCMLALIAGSLDVITRLAIGSSLAWAQKLTIWATITYALLLAGNGAKEKAHIAIDILFKMLKGMPSKVVDIINRIAILAMACLLSAAGFSYAQMLGERGVTRVFGWLHIPYWPILFFLMGVPCAIFAIYSLIVLVNTIRMPPESRKGGEKK